MIAESASHSIAAPGAPETAHLIAYQSTALKVLCRSENAPAGTGIEILAAMVGGVAGAVEVQRGV